MEITGINEIPEEISGDMTIALPPDKVDFDLYSCFFCGRLITPEQEKQAFKTGFVCICGSNKYRPAKVLNADPQEDGSYLVTGPFGETVRLEKEAFESTYKAVVVE